MINKRKAPEEPTPVSFLQQLKNAREKKDNTKTLCCDHPLCSDSLPNYYPRSGPRFCEKHAKKYASTISGAGANVVASDADLMPDEEHCSRSKCTQYRRESTIECHVQWLFTCDTCKKKVCCFCAKECHKAGHGFSNVEFTSDQCQRTQIVEILRHFVVKSWSVDGKCSRITKDI